MFVDSFSHAVIPLSSFCIFLQTTMQTRLNFMWFSHCFNLFLPFPGNGSKMSMGSWPPKISCARICRTWTRSWSPFRSLRFVSTGCGNAPRKSSDTSLNQIAMQILLVEGNYIYLQDVTTLTAISSHVSLTRQGLA